LWQGFLSAMIAVKKQIFCHFIGRQLIWVWWTHLANHLADHGVVMCCVTSL
jgi:hypothetical protein